MVERGRVSTLHEFFGDTRPRPYQCIDTISNWAASPAPLRPSAFIESPTGPTATAAAQAMPAMLGRTLPASFGKLILLLYVSKDSWKVFFFGAGFLPKLEKSKLVACGRLPGRFAAGRPLVARWTIHGKYASAVCWPASTIFSVAAPVGLHDRPARAPTNRPTWQAVQLTGSNAKRVAACLGTLALQQRCYLQLRGSAAARKRRTLFRGYVPDTSENIIVILSPTLVPSLSCAPRCFSPTFPRPVAAAALAVIALALGSPGSSSVVVARIVVSGMSESSTPTPRATSSKVTVVPGSTADRRRGPRASPLTHQKRAALRSPHRPQGLPLLEQALAPSSRRPGASTAPATASVRASPASPAPAWPRPSSLAFEASRAGRAATPKGARCLRPFFSASSVRGPQYASGS